MALLEAMFGSSVASPHDVEPAEARKLGELRKKLRWTIANPPADLAKKMTITPDLAAVMLERNADDEWRNRPQSERGQARYVKAMKRGWKLTGEPIIFSKSGRLLNGQHRLTACTQAQANFDCLVVFGIDDDAFKFMDVGITRTAAHIFAIEDIPNYAQVAAVCRLLYGYFTKSNWDGRAPEVENDQLLAFYDHHKDVQDSLTVARHLYQAKLLPIRWGGFVHYVSAQKSRSDADLFWDQVASGVGFSGKNSAAYLIRKRLFENAAEAKKVDQVYLGAFSVMAWNSFRRPDGRKIFRWRGDQNPHEAFPRAV
jgi:hypothetical protein